jgi:hypothetical protein
LGIRTIVDLAQLSSDTLKLQLKQAGYTLSSSEVEGWIAQAQALVSTLEQSTEANSAPTDPVVGGQALPIDWEVITSFKVDCRGSFAVALQSRQINGTTEQRTLIQHLETGKQETIAGVNQDKLQRWILNQLSANLQIESPQIESSQDAEPIAVEITRLQFFQVSRSGQPMIANKSMPLFPDALVAEQPFSLEVTIQLPAATLNDLGNQLMILHAACEARHLASGQTIILGETRLNAIGGNTSGFTLLIPDMALEEIGNYRLRVTATIDNLPATPDLFKVPILELESANPPVCLI